MKTGKYKLQYLVDGEPKCSEYLPTIKILKKDIFNILEVGLYVEKGVRGEHVKNIDKSDVYTDYHDNFNINDGLENANDGVSDAEFEANLHNNSDQQCHHIDNTTELQDFTRADDQNTLHENESQPYTIMKTNLNGEVVEVKTAQLNR